MLGDFASLDVQNTYRGSDAYDSLTLKCMSVLCFQGKDFFLMNLILMVGKVLVWWLKNLNFIDFKGK
ncbi:hypothetical protein ACGP04_15295 [Piscirickettsia salmonis]